LLTLERLGRQYAFSTFLDRKFNTSKRFGIEGLDSMASGLLTLVDTAASSKVLLPNI
jgi:2-oxoglutarate dehydrogenase E1 component